jgi:hypothetical protein
MTVTMLLVNTVTSAEHTAGLSAALPSMTPAIA